VIQAAGAALAFVLQLVLARALGAEQYGVFAFYFAMAIIAGTWGRLGSDVVVMRLGGIAQEQGNLHEVRRLLSHGQRTAMAGGLFAGILVAATVVLAGIPASQPIMLISVVALIVIVAVNGVWQAALLTLKRSVIALAPDQLLRPLIGLAVVFFCVGAGWMLESDAAMMILAVAALAALLTVIGRSWSLLPADAAAGRDPAERDRLMRLGFALMVVNAAYLLLYHADTLILGFWLTPEAIGPYQVAKQVAQLGLFGMVAIQYAQSPQIAGYAAAGNGAELGRQIRAIRWTGAAFAGAVLIGFAGLGEWFLSKFGAAFGAAYELGLIMLAGQLAVALVGPAGILATMSGNQSVAAVVYAVGAFLMLIVGPIAVGRAGLQGAALAQSAIAVACALAIWARVRARVPALR
jgi:O-antigen/teichoic acid export membrane protein